MLSTRRSPVALFALGTIALLGATGCSGGDDDAGGPGSEVTAGGPVDLVGPPATNPAASGDAAACPTAPFRLTVRTATGEERTVPAPAAFAVPIDNGTGWRVVTGDAPLDAATVAVGNPDPAGKVQVVVRLSTVGRPEAVPLQAGETFQPVDPTRRPEAVSKVADADVRTAADQNGATAGLTGSVAVDAVTAEQVCLTIDLRRPVGAQVSGAVAARVVQPPSAAAGVAPGGGHGHGEEGHEGEGPDSGPSPTTP